jgi:hypothetical protein
MAINAQVYSPSEFKFYMQEEEAVGTANKATMLQLNVNDIVTWSQEVIQTLDPRSGGSGRVIAAADVFTRDIMQLSTITVPLVYDMGTANTFQMLLENAVAVDESNGTVTVSYDHNPAELEHGDSGTDGDGTFTLCIASPVADESIYFTGCVVTSMTVTADAGTNGGRIEGSVTFQTRYRPADGAAAPTTPTTYTSEWHYLCELTTKTVGAVDVVVNKFEYTIENPVAFVGCDSDGNPQIIARSIPKIAVTGNVSIKYDANTAFLWQNRRAGTSTAIVMTGADAVGFTATYAKITGDVNPSGGDDGVFIELPFEATASTSGAVAVFRTDEPDGAP